MRSPRLYIVGPSRHQAVSFAHQQRIETRRWQYLATERGTDGIIAWSDDLLVILPTSPRPGTPGADRIEEIVALYRESGYKTSCAPTVLDLRDATGIDRRTLAPFCATPEGS